MLLKEKELADFIENNIDDAIESGRIRVFYQPIVRNLTKEVSSSEALARWSDPKMGLITPEYFIPTLEKTGQIHKLDCYMVEKVCQEMRRALNLKMPVIPTSINFSRLDFTTLDMLEFIEKTIQTYDIPRDFIHIEITESMIASDEEMMKRTINDFRNAGYEIWMDDFGSGYSSLNLLKDYDFDAIKLDMKFLSSINERSKTILKHTLNMAKEIGVKTLAEGVENPEQVMLLEELGCGLLVQLPAQILKITADRRRNNACIILHIDTGRCRRLRRNLYCSPLGLIIHKEPDTCYHGINRHQQQP